MKARILITLAVASLTVFIIYCYLTNNTKIIKYFTFSNILRAVLLFSLLYFTYNYFNPTIVYKANMIGSKRYMNNVSQLSSLKDTDLEKIKELTIKFRI